jgi:hypothetical protein
VRPLQAHKLKAEIEREKKLADGILESRTLNPPTQ